MACACMDLRPVASPCLGSVLRLCVPKCSSLLLQDCNCLTGQAFNRGA